MDDTTVNCSNEAETRGMLERLDRLMSWGMMNLNPKKSGSLSVKKSIVDAARTLTVAN